MAFSGKKPLSVRAKLFLLILVALVPVLLIQGYVYYDRFQARQEEEFEANLEVARSVGRTFEEFVQDVLRQELAIGIVATSSPTLAPEDFVRLLEKSAEAFPAVRNFAFASSRGLILVSTRSAAGTDYSDREYFKEIAAGREWVVSDLLSSRATGDPVFTITRGVRDRTGNLLGVVIATILPDRLGQVLGIERGKKAGVSLFDGQGMLVCRHPPVQSELAQRDWLTTLPVLEKVLQGSEVATYVSGPDRVRTLSGFVPVPSTGWISAAGRPEEDVFGSIVSSTLYHGVLFLIVTIASFGAAAAFSRPIAHSISVLRNHALALGRGEVEPRTAFSGPLEIEELAHAFDDMAGKVRDRETALRESEEGSRERAEELERLMDLAPAAIWVSRDPECRSIVGNKEAGRLYETTGGADVSSGTAGGEVLNTERRFFSGERELKPEELPMQQAVSKGADILNQEMGVLLPSGRRITILGNASPLFDDQGRVRGCLGVYMDITERKLIENTQSFLAQYGWAASGEDFFESLTRYLGVNLGMDYVCIDRLEGDSFSARISGVNPDSKLEPRLPCTLKDNPCGEVVKNGTCCFPREVRRLFPKDLFLQEVQAESYVGTVLRDSKGNRIGLIGLIGRHPLPNPHLAESILRLVSIRAAGELERKQAEDKIRELSQRLSYHVENTPLAVIEWGPDMRLTRWSREAERLFGWRAEEVLGKCMDDFRWIYKEDRTEVAEVTEQLVSGENPRGFSLNRNYRKDGSVVHCEWYNSSLLDDSGNLRSILSLVLDVTGRKQKEELFRARLALLEFAASHTAEELLRKALDEIGALTDSPIGFFHFVAEDQKTLVLQAWSTRTEREFCKAEGKGLHYPIAKAGVWVDCVRARAPVVHNDYESLPHRKGLPQGHPAISRELVVPLMRQGRIVAVLGVGNKPDDYTQRDIESASYLADVAWEVTMRKQAEEALMQSEQRYKSLSAELELRVRERTAELERRNEELQHFTFSAAHDMQEPLRKIQTFSDLIVTRCSNSVNEQGSNYLKRITETATRMRDVLQSLLDYSGLTSRPESFGPVDLKEIAREVVSNLEFKIRDADAPVEIGDLPEIEADAGQMRRLLQELVENALKFGREGERPEARIHGTMKNGECEIYVEDNGIGFEEKFLDRIFKPFQRLHGRKEYGGVGMGLAICAKIAEHHNGRITARSTPGKGSTFIVTLPMKRVEP